MTITSSWPSASTAITDGLREDVADVAAREEDRRRQADDDDQEEQDQRRPGAQREQRRLQQAVAIETRRSRAVVRSVRLRRADTVMRHPTSDLGRATRPGPSGNSYSSSDAGSISML